MRSGAVRLAGRGLGVVAAACAPAALSAQQAQTGLVVSTGVSAETNPYNVADPGGAAVAATAEFRPRAELRDETTVVNIDGLAQFRQFLDRYGLEDNYGVNASMASRRSETFTIRATADFASSESGFNVFSRPGLSAFDPNAVATLDPATTITDLVQRDASTLLTDVTLLGQRSRTTTFGSGLGLDTRLTSRSQLSINTDVRALRVGAFGFNDYNSVSAEAQYSHSVSELTSVGLIGSIARTDYLGSSVGDAKTASALVSLDRRFSQRWALSLSVGASFTSINQLPGQPNTHLTALNVRGRFCRQDELSQLCVSAQRSPEPAANGSVRISDALGVDYSRRLSERERLSLGGTYSRTGRGRGVQANLPGAEFVSANARYDNQFRERASFFVSGSFGKIFSDSLSRRANFGAALGVQYRFGALR